MATSRIPATIDYLVTLFTNAPTLGGANPPINVYDGPIATEIPAQLTLWVGMDDPDSEQAPTSATSEQNWAALGKQAKDENLTVNCVAEAWSGDTDVRSTRVAVFAILAAVEDVLRADVYLGGNVQFAGVSNVTFRQNNVSAGSIARIVFSIDAMARI